MTDDENAVLGALITAWNEFIKLPRLHSEEQDEFRFHIHALQHMLMCRPELRKRLNETGS